MRGKGAQDTVPEDTEQGEVLNIQEEAPDTAEDAREKMTNTKRKSQPTTGSKEKAN
jgi:hypothetical protein